MCYPLRIMSNSAFEKSFEKSSDKSIESKTSGGGSSAPVSPTMTLQKAVDLGEYDPNYLATFPEWHELSRNAQWQMIEKAINARENQLVHQWAGIVNIIDFRLKPHLKDALKNIEEQKRKVLEDKEQLIVEYSKA